MSQSITCTFDQGIQSLFKAEEEKSDFILFNENWIELQAAVLKALCLPINTDDFKNVYGDFAEEEEIANSVNTMKRLREIMEEFGSAIALNEELENLAPGEEPEKLYSKIVWLAHEIIAKSKVFHYTYEGFQMIAKINDPEERLVALKDILMGKNGLHEQAGIMVKRSNELVRDLSEFIGRYGLIHKDVIKYASPEAEVYKAAIRHHEDLKETIESKAADLSRVESSYKTSVAVSTVGSLAATVIPPPGTGILIGLGIGFGVGFGVAEKLRKQKNELKEEIEGLETEKKKAATLVADLTELHSSFGEVNKDMAEVSQNLSAINNTWLEQQKSFEIIANQTKPEDLVDFSAFMMAFNVSMAQDMWNDVTEAVRQFTKVCVFTVTTQPMAA